MGKSVESYDQYKYNGTDYLLVKTSDGYIVFSDQIIPFLIRLSSVRDQMRSYRDCFLPDNVVNSLEDSSMDVTDMYGRQSSKRRDNQNKGFGKDKSG